MQPRHIAIAGMAYGDEGKGTMVDFLARSRDANGPTWKDIIAGVGIPEFDVEKLIAGV